MKRDHWQASWIDKMRNDPPAAHLDEYDLAWPVHGIDERLTAN